MDGHIGVAIKADGISGTIRAVTDGKVLFEQIKDWFSEHASHNLANGGKREDSRELHGEMKSLQLIGEDNQMRCHRREGTKLLLYYSRRDNDP